MNDQTHDWSENVEAFTRMWTDFASRMSQAGASGSAPQPSPEMAQAFRDAFFRSMSEYAEEFMRSPEFLKMMRESLSQSIQARKQINDWLGQVWHEFQGTSRQDVDQIMLALRHVEQRMVEEFEKVDAKVTDLNNRLDSLEKKVTAGDKSGAKPARKSSSGKSAGKKVGSKSSTSKAPSKNKSKDS